MGGQRRRAGGKDSLHPNCPFPVSAIPGCNTDGADWVIDWIVQVYMEEEEEEESTFE